MADTLDPKEPTVWLRACEMETRLAQLRDDVDRLCGDIAGTGRYEAVGALNDVFVSLGRARLYLKTARRALAEMNEEEVVP